jgi:CDP-diacylglycerol--serine O-phosphatidyltransferase
MVSNVRYYSGKDINLRRSVPFMVVFLIAMGFMLIAYSPPEMLFGVVTVYALSGYVMGAWALLHKKPKQ